jgi:N-acetylglucosamine kinase-like BadF-type ATPase
MPFLGVDGGGTKTAALLVDGHGQVLGWGIAGGSNYHLVGLESAFSSVRQSIEAALHGHVPDAVCYCMASADMPFDFVQLRSKLSELDLNCPFSLHNDVIGIFRAGSRFPFGVGIVGGTGFNAGGLGKDGGEFRLPALGSITGDCAGAHHLAVEAVGAAFRAWDGRGRPTLLANAVLRALGSPDFETVAERWVQRELTTETIKSLAPLVFEVSEAGDPVAQQLIREQGVELGTAANAVLRRLDLTEEDCDVVLGGSLFYGKGDLLMNTINETIDAVSSKAVVKRLDVPPVVGAILLAVESAGAAVGEQFVATLRRTLPQEVRPRSEVGP